MRLQVRGKRFTARPGLGDAVLVTGPDGWTGTAYRPDPVFEPGVPLRDVVRKYILRVYFGERTSDR